MEKLLEKYYEFTLKHEKTLDVLHDKAIEFSIKFPIWFLIQLFFWYVGRHFYTNVGFFTSVYDVFVHHLPKDVSYLIEVSVYYIIIDPILEALVAIADDWRNRK